MGALERCEQALEQHLAGFRAGRAALVANKEKKDTGPDMKRIKQSGDRLVYVNGEPYAEVDGKLLMKKEGLFT